MSGVVKYGYYFFVKTIDKGALEFLGPLGLSNFFGKASIHASSLQSGLIYHYAFVFLLGLVALLSMFALNLSILYFVEPSFLFIITFVVISVLVFN